MFSMATSAARALIDLLYVPECGACGRTLLGAEKSACASCLVSLRPTDHGFRPDDNPVYANFGFAQNPPAGAAAGFHFEGAMREFIHAFKYHNRRDVARRLGMFWGEKLSKQPLGARIAYLVPAPLHKRKLRERGYNQATELARGLSRILNVPVVECLTRVRYTRQQALLNRSERLINTVDSMRADATLAGKTGVAVVDDVVTTGATLNAAAQALYAAGVPPVFLIALAAADASVV
ncbi:MAG: phosphoribosyltransferase family protein [Bacteroidia bacterium]|nr:phosphoribosyltransferase family protein [Bacteroidia bacterium]MDW8333902.1 phosphoribosyltransferase family protein [Bacteroidia bacterium]